MNDRGGPTRLTSYAFPSAASGAALLGAVLLGGCEWPLGPTTIELGLEAGEQLERTVGQPPSEYAWGLFNNDVTLRQLAPGGDISPQFVHVCAAQVEQDTVVRTGCTDVLAVQTPGLFEGVRVGRLTEESFWFRPRRIRLLQGAPNRAVGGDGVPLVEARQEPAVSVLVDRADLAPGETLIAVYAKRPAPQAGYATPFPLRVRPFGLVFPSQ